MKRLILAVALLLPGAAYAQTAPQQPSERSIINVLHAQLQQATDALTLAQARVADLEQQIAAAKVAAPQPLPPDADAVAKKKLLDFAKKGIPQPTTKKDH